MPRKLQLAISIGQHKSSYLALAGVDPEFLERGFKFTKGDRFHNVTFVWPTLFLLNDFIALKGTHLLGSASESDSKSKE